MFRHIVIFQWASSADEQQIADALTALDEWRSVAAEFGTLQVTVDAGLSVGNGDAVVIAEFANREGYIAYAEDPRHTRMVADFIKPILARRLAVQSEV